MAAEFQKRENSCRISKSREQLQNRTKSIPYLQTLGGTSFNANKFLRKYRHLVDQ